MTTIVERDVPQVRPARRMTWSWLGVVPFFLFAFLFIVAPVAYLVSGSFQNNEGQTTLQNYADLGTAQVGRAFANSIEISLVTAIAGAILGLLLAYAIVLGGLPNFLRGFVVTFAGVASNFAGIPLALAFIGSTDKDAIAAIKALEVKHGHGWVAEWLRGRDLNLDDYMNTPMNNFSGAPA